MDNINKFAKGQGYAVATFQSKTNKQTPLTVQKIWLWCAKGRTYTSTSRTRFSGSCMIEYPFKATLTRILIGQGLEVKDPAYNYAVAINLIALL